MFQLAVSFHLPLTALADLSGPHWPLRPAPYPRRHPFFASANRSGGPTKGDIQLFTCKADTLLSQLLHKVGYFT